MERRNFLKAAGGAAGAATLGGAGLLATTGGAAASGSFDYGGVTITSDDGSVEYVAVYGDSVVNWTGFDTPADSFTIDIALTVVDKEDGSTVHKQQIHSTSQVDVSLGKDWGNHDESISTENGGTSGTIESGIGLDENGEHDPSIDWHIVQDPDAASADEYGLPSDPVDAQYLRVSTDGGSRSFRLEMDSTYTWYDANGNRIFQETFPSAIPVTVNNEPKSASAEDGDGDDGAVGA